MSGRREGYYGPGDGDLARGFLALLVLGTLGVALVVVLCVFSFGDPHAEPHRDFGSAGLAIDVTDAWAMHDACLPTRADVMAWHMYGRWGFSVVKDGRQSFAVMDELPGGAWVWDELYGLDGANAAFRYR